MKSYLFLITYILYIFNYSIRVDGAIQDYQCTSYISAQYFDFSKISSDVDYTLVTPKVQFSVNFCHSTVTTCYTRDDSNPANPNTNARRQDGTTGILPQDSTTSSTTSPTEVTSSSVSEATTDQSSTTQQNDVTSQSQSVTTQDITTELTSESVTTQDITTELTSSAITTSDISTGITSMDITTMDLTTQTPLPVIYPSACISNDSGATWYSIGDIASLMYSGNSSYPIARFSNGYNGTSMVIHFLCALGQQSVNNLTYIGELVKGEYHFQWATQSACPWVPSVIGYFKSLSTFQDTLVGILTTGIIMSFITIIAFCVLTFRRK